MNNPVEFLIKGEPVKILNGDEFTKIEGQTFAEQVLQYFIENGCRANTSFGEVILDNKGIQSSKSHGMSRIKAASFAAIKNVLEQGCIILPLKQYKTNNKKEETGMIAAPISINGERYVCVVVVIANLTTKKLYVHESFLTKNLQAIVASNSIHSRDNSTSSQSFGDIAKVLHNFLTTKSNDLNNPKDNVVVKETNKNNNDETNENLQYNFMNYNEKKALYESIMKDVAKIVKHKVNEADEDWSNYELDVKAKWFISRKLMNLEIEGKIDRRTYRLLEKELCDSYVLPRPGEEC